MSKRKWGDSPEKQPSDFGLGATLAYLNRGESAFPPQTAVEDDEGWTKVGAPKKKRKQKDGSGRPSNGSRRRSSTSSVDSQSKQGSERRQAQDKTHDERPLALPNPFAKDAGDGEHASPPSNPFSTKKSRDERSEQSPVDSSARDERHKEKSRDRRSPERSSKEANTSSDGKQERELRRKERKLERNYPAIEHCPSARLNSHLKITDFQTLLLYLLADGHAPQWVSVRKRTSINQVVVLMVPGLELGMFNGDVALESQGSSSVNNGDSKDFADASVATTEKSQRPKRIDISPDHYYPADLKRHRLPEVLKPLADIFPNVWPIRAQGDYRGRQFVKLHSPIHTMLTSQIPKTREEKQMKKDHKGPLPQNTKHWENKRTRITEYIASLAEQQENEYVIHPAWFTTPESKAAALERRKAARQTAEDGWVDSKVSLLEDAEVPEKEIEEGSVTAERRILTIDCEMCKSEHDEFVLTRISALDWDGNVVVDKLVKPDVTIKDYLTQYSGITEAMLQDVTTTLSDIQTELLEIITPRTILVGHSLNSDLNALKLTHPFIIDTGIVFPHARGPPYKQSLKWLCQKFLSREIQKGSKGHDSVEDARACLDLVKQKCERGPRWGTGDTNAESIFKRLSRSMRPKQSNQTRAGAVVDWGEPSRGHGAQAQVALGCKSDQEVVEGIERAVKGLAEGKTGATEKVDLVWGRLRELELARGWWDDARTSEDVEALRKAALQRMGRISEETGSELEDEVVGGELGEAVSRTIDNIVRVYKSLPSCTGLMVYSGTGDPREMRRLNAMHQQYRREYATKHWDNLSVQWTDTEVQALSQACEQAREGVGFVVVK